MHGLSKRRFSARLGAKKHVSSLTRERRKARAKKILSSCVLKHAKMNEYLLKKECFVKASQMHGLTKRRLSGRLGAKKTCEHINSRAPKGASEDNLELSCFKTCKINEYLVENVWISKTHQPRGLVHTRFFGALGQTSI